MFCLSSVLNRTFWDKNRNVHNSKLEVTPHIRIRLKSILHLTIGVLKRRSLLTSVQIVVSVQSVVSSDIKWVKR